MSHTFLLPCGKLDGQPPGGSVKHTVVSGIFGFITAVVAVLTVDFLRQRVLLALKQTALLRPVLFAVLRLDFKHPVAIRA